MIIITRIEYLDLGNKTEAEIMTYEPHKAGVPVLYDTRREGPNLVQADYLREKLLGRRFRRPSDGRDIVLGLPKREQALLGLMYDSYDTLETSLKITAGQLARCEATLKQYRTMTFWQRLRFAFKNRYW